MVIDLQTMVQCTCIDTQHPCSGSGGLHFSLVPPLAIVVLSSLGLPLSAIHTPHLQWLATYQPAIVVSDTAT